MPSPQHVVGLSLAAIGIAVAAVVMVLAFYFGLIRPQFARLDRLRDDVRGLRAARPVEVGDAGAKGGEAGAECGDVDGHVVIMPTDVAAGEGGQLTAAARRPSVSSSCDSWTSGKPTFSSNALSVTPLQS